MPFITEEIWQKLPGGPGLHHGGLLPRSGRHPANPAAEAEMGLVMDTITAIRNIRCEMNVPPATQVDVFLQSPEAGDIAALQRHRQSINMLARVRELTLQFPAGPPAAAAKAVVGRGNFHAPGRRHRLRRRGPPGQEMDKLGKELPALNAK